MKEAPPNYAPRPGSFESMVCPKATLADLNTELISSFLARAGSARGLPLSENATPTELLNHLNLLDEGHLTNASVLLFARKPQRFLISSVVTCSHFDGTATTKPSRHTFKGTVFELVDQCVDHIMSRINLGAALSEPKSAQIPVEVVREAVVNAVAHREYTSEDSIRVRLFSDRLEVTNPGTLPPSLTLEMLRRPHDSVPRNPLIAKALYLARYTERIGTGTRDMIMGSRGVGLPVPQFFLKDGFVASFDLQPKEESTSR